LYVFHDSVQNILLFVAAAFTATNITEITLQATRVFPESITSTADGAPPVERRTAWIVEGKLNYRDDRKLNDAGAFKMY